MKKGTTTRHRPLFLLVLGGAALLIVLLVLMLRLARGADAPKLDALDSASVERVDFTCLHHEQTAFLLSNAVLESRKEIEQFCTILAREADPEALIDFSGKQTVALFTLLDESGASIFSFHIFKGDSGCWLELSPTEGSSAQWALPQEALDALLAKVDCSQHALPPQPLPWLCQVGNLQSASLCLRQEDGTLTTPCVLTGEQLQTCCEQISAAAPEFLASGSIPGSGWLLDMTLVGGTQVQLIFAASVHDRLILTTQYGTDQFGSSLFALADGHNLAALPELLGLD